jgi:hypothetical protein
VVASEPLSRRCEGYDHTDSVVPLLLYIDMRPPYAAQESEELGDEVVARLSPDTGAVENLEVLFFSTRLLRTELFTLPVTAELWPASQDSA